MGTVGWIRCCLWRATLYGFLLGTAFDGFCHAVFGTLNFPLVGAIV